MIRVTNLVKEFAGGVRAVDNVSFEVSQGSLVTLLGPSGCGKTTTLRCIAGLERASAGQIKIGERTVFSSDERIFVPANRRNIGMVFQSYAIWPHMTVFDNVAYPLKGTGVSQQEIRERTMRALELVGLELLASRPAPNLSGGQQQRVALARSLVAEPEVLLLDEPLSNLDAKLRESMRQELRELQQRLGITTLYVTHDQIEALAISDLVIIMSRGRIVESGEPQRIYESPSTRFAAEFIGLANVVTVRNLKGEGDVTEGQCEWGLLRFAPAEGNSHAGSATEGGEVAVMVRPEDLEVSPEPQVAQPNLWRGRLVSALFLGTHYDCVIEIGRSRLRAQLPRGITLRGGDEVFVSVRPDCCIPLRQDLLEPARVPESEPDVSLAGA